MALVKTVVVTNGLVQSGTSGTAATADIANDAVDFNKLRDIATATLIGRSTAGTGNAEEITPSTTHFSLFAGAMTLASGGVNTTQLAADAVDNAKLRNSGACSVIGRSANSSGDPADISAASNETALFRTGDALSFLAAPRWNAVVPSTTTSSGVEGQLAEDGSFLYVCISANSWRRVALATW